MTIDVPEMPLDGHHMSCDKNFSYLNNYDDAVLQLIPTPVEQRLIERLKDLLSL
jgi:hypothetical protein